MTIATYTRTLLQTALAGVLAVGLTVSALAEDVERAPTDTEVFQVNEALTNAGYKLVDDIQVEDDQFTAIAKQPDDKDVRVRLDMNSLKIVQVEPLP